MPVIDPTQARKPKPQPAREKATETLAIIALALVVALAILTSAALTIGLLTRLLFWAAGV
jgi:hypothetical protein